MDFFSVEEKQILNTLLGKKISKQEAEKLIKISENLTSINLLNISQTYNFFERNLYFLDFQILMLKKKSYFFQISEINCRRIWKFFSLLHILML